MAAADRAAALQQALTPRNGPGTSAAIGKIWQVDLQVLKGTEYRKKTVPKTKM